MMEENKEKKEIVRAMMDVEYYPVDSKSATLDHYTKFPLTEMSSLGIAFSSLPASFRTITQTINSGTETGLFRAIMPNGVAGELAKAKDGVGTWGNVINKKGTIVGRSRFVEVAGSPTKITTVVPYNPAMLFMAAALMGIERKLDHIVEAQLEIIEFLKQKEKAKLRGNLNFLNDILHNYKHNWDNEKYKNNNHIKVLDIKQDAEQSILFYREQISKKLKKKSFFQSDKGVKDKLNAIQSEFEEYQLALYLYSFASFLEVMLLENFESAYLEGICEKIENYAVRYRELYTECYGWIEKHAKSSVEANILGGLASINKVAGDTVAKIPIVSKSQIDETLVKTSGRLGTFSSKRTERMIEPLISRQNSAVYPFVENINTINKLYNRPMELIFDEENIYLCPSEEERS